MRPSDVLRGSALAYAVTVALGAVIVAVASAETIVDAVVGTGVSLLILGGYGAIPLIPAVMAAMVSYYALREIVSVARWWHPVAVVFGWTALILGALVPEIGVVLWAVMLAIVSGPAFWIGAAGWRWSVPVDAGCAR